MVILLVVCVYRGCFFLSVCVCVTCFSFYLSLRARQVDQVEFAHPNRRRSVGARLAALYRDGVNRMRARRIRVHFGRTHVPVNFKGENPQN